MAVPGTIPPLNLNTTSTDTGAATVAVDKRINFGNIEKGGNSTLLIVAVVLLGAVAVWRLK